MTPTAYHFWSPTCGPCKVIKPMIEDLKEEFDQVTWVSVNTHADPENYAQKYGVSVVPTVVVVYDNFMEKHSGTQAVGYYRILRNVIRANQQS